MVFIRDDGSVFEAPIEAVWEYVGSGDPHSEAHRHRKVSRTRLSETSGSYSWEQDFDGSPTRFSLRWTTFRPVGIAYEALEGPFAGSTFFFYYAPRRQRTAVTVVGEFVSPTLPPDRIEPAVMQFFATEYEQDRVEIEHRTGRALPVPQGPTALSTERKGPNSRRTKPG